MGAFIDQVQALNSEAKQKRLAAEQKQKKKAQQEKLKMQLYNYLSSFFEESDPIFENKKEIYYNLLKHNNKWNIIQQLTQNEDLQYFLAIHYNSILDNVKKSYFIIQEHNERKRKEFEKEEQKEAEQIKQMELLQQIEIETLRQQRTQVTSKLLKNIAFIVFLPIALIFSICYHIAKGK